MDVLRLLKAPKGGFLLTLLVAGCVTLASAQVTPVATDLNNPRGLAFGPNGVLYVTEAGLGAGNGAGGVGPGLGFTGSVGEINGLSSGHPTYHRIITGLASQADAGGVVGPDGVSALGNGDIHVIMAESTSGVSVAFPGSSPAVTRQFGRLLKSSQSGQWKVVADVGDFDYQWAFDNRNAPFAPVGQFPDANPYAVLSVPGHEYVADAGANTVDEVDQDGAVRLIAFVPNPKVQLGPNLVTVSDSVPTCVAKGADGFLYVGTLTFGAFFATHAPQSKIYRVNPALTNAILTDADVWASGFNPITGCGFSNGAFYATEFFTAASGLAHGDVVRVAVNPDGSAGARTALGGSALMNPNGFAARDGSIYVSNHSVSAAGQVVRVDQ